MIQKQTKIKKFRGFIILILYIFLSIKAPVNAFTGTLITPTSSSNTSITFNSPSTIYNYLENTVHTETGDGVCSMRLDLQGYGNPPYTDLVAGTGTSCLNSGNTLSNGIHVIYISNGGFSSGDYYYINYTVVNNLITEINGTSILGGDFTPFLYLPDNTPISSGYDYQGTNYSGIKLKLIGSNNFGLFDTFYFTISEDGTNITPTPVAIPINITCDNCTLLDTTFNNLGAVYKRGHNYNYQVTMGSEIVDPIIKSFSVSFDLASEIVNYEDCSTGDITCYIRNGLKWAFTVPPSSFDDFLTLKEDLEQKPPFGYITSAFNSLLGINGTSTGDYIMGEVTGITDNIFTPIRVGLSWFFYLVFIFGLIKRFKEIQV